MVVRIRLARHGQRNRAFYRIVAADSRSPRDGRHLDILGFYDPIPHSCQERSQNLKRVGLNIPRIKYWLSVGAQPSDTVGRLLGSSGLLPRFPRSYRDPSVQPAESASEPESASDNTNVTSKANSGVQAVSATVPTGKGFGAILSDASQCALPGVLCRTL